MCTQFEYDSALFIYLFIHSFAFICWRTDVHRDAH
jgi:hypothetical protein